MAFAYAKLPVGRHRPPMEIIRTNEFQLTHGQIAMAGAKLYLGTFWWLLIGVPLAGLFAVLFIDVPMIKYLGAICLLWPLTVPARAGIITAKTGRQLMRPTVAEISREAIVFESVDEGKQVRTGLRYPFLLSVRVRDGLYVLVTKRFGYTLIPVAAFKSDADRAAFEGFVRANGVRGSGF